MTCETVDRVLDRLIEALAPQLGSSPHPALSPGAVTALTELSRAEANLIFSRAGHLVHYGAETEPLTTLIRLISDLQRDETTSDADIAPGDEVRLVSDPPDGLAAETDAALLSKTVYVVRYVGDDETVDVQPELWED